MGMTFMQDFWPRAWVIWALGLTDVTCLKLLALSQQDPKPHQTALCQH